MNESKEELKKDSALLNNFSDEYQLLIDRVVRWDKYRISQLSITNNLFLTYCVGFLAYFVSQAGFVLNNEYCIICLFQYLSIILLGISFITGTLTTISRLEDFRKTSKLTKHKKHRYEYFHQNKKEINIDELESKILTLGATTKKWGDRTWRLLYWQIWSFFIGLFLGVIYLILIKNTYG